MMNPVSHRSSTAAFVIAAVCALIFLSAPLSAATAYLPLRAPGQSGLVETGMYLGLTWDRLDVRFELPDTPENLEGPAEVLAEALAAARRGNTAIYDALHTDNTGRERLPQLLQDVRAVHLRGRVIAGREKVLILWEMVPREGAELPVTMAIDLLTLTDRGWRIDDQQLLTSDPMGLVVMALSDQIGDGNFTMPAAAPQTGYKVGLVSAGERGEISLWFDATIPGTQPWVMLDSSYVAATAETTEPETLRAYRSIWEELGDFYNGAIEDEVNMRRMMQYFTRDSLRRLGARPVPATLEKVFPNFGNRRYLGAVEAGPLRYVYITDTAEERTSPADLSVDVLDLSADTPKLAHIGRSYPLRDAMLTAPMREFALNPREYRAQEAAAPR